MAPAWLRAVFVQDPLKAVNRTIDCPDWWQFGRVHPSRMADNQRVVRVVDRQIRDGVKRVRQERA